MSRPNVPKKSAGGGHNPSPYMRRFQLPTLSFSEAASGYDDLLSPLETEAKQQFIDEKNQQLLNYFGTKTTPNSAPRIASKSGEVESRPVVPVFEAPLTKPHNTVITKQPPPIPPHRPHPRQRLLEIEKMRMCQQILELERRSQAMYDMLVVPSPRTK